MKNLAKKGMALGLIAAMLCATTVTAATNRAGSIVSTGSVTMNTDIGSATIDADDIYENAVAIDNIDSQLAGLYFKYQDGYYWASKDSGNTWEKIGAVGNAEPWMVLSNDGTKDITFSSESGVDISGTMANYGSGTVTANTGAKSGDYLALTVPSTGYYDTSSKVQYALSSLGTVPANYVLKDQTFTSSAGVKVSGTMANYGSGTVTANTGAKSGDYLALTVPNTGYYDAASKIQYALSSLGDAATSNVLTGKTFTSSAGVKVSGSMANKSGTTVTATTGAKSGDYLALTVPSTGYYDTSSKVQYALSSLGTVPANYVLKDQTFTSSAGVKVSGTMANYGSGTEYISSSGTTKNIGSTSYLSLAVPATGYYTTSSRINYALSHFGSAAKSEVLNGKTFTSTAGISVSGSMANKSGTTVAASTLSSIAVSGVNYLGVTIPSAGYYDTTSKLRTSVKYNPSGTITKPSTAPSYTEYSTAGNYTNTTYDLTLASGTQLTLPAGYYDNSINVYSKGSGDAVKFHTIKNWFEANSSHLLTVTSGKKYIFMLVTVNSYSSFSITHGATIDKWLFGSSTSCIALGDQCSLACCGICTANADYITYTTNATDAWQSGMLLFEIL